VGKGQTTEQGLKEKEGEQAKGEHAREEGEGHQYLRKKNFQNCQKKIGALRTEEVASNMMRSTKKGQEKGWKRRKKRVPGHRLYN